MTSFACIENVIFVLYQACLRGEITQSEFEKSKEIVKRAKHYTTTDILHMTAKIIPTEKNHAQSACTFSREELGVIGLALLRFCADYEQQKHDDPFSISSGAWSRNRSIADGILQRLIQSQFE